VWDEAKAVAGERGERFADVVEVLLRRYVQRNKLQT